MSAADGRDDARLRPDVSRDRPEGADPREVAVRVAGAAHGLLFTSEIDAPFEPFWMIEPAGDDLDERSLKRLLGTRKLELLSVEELLAGHTDEVDPGDARAMAEVPRFRELIAAIRSSLDGAVAVRIPTGPTELRVLIVGRTGGGVAGIETVAVES